ncbi:hypothetical protein GcC1_139023 [Golovinomyces cichoracearum]|uniref:Uncharacterized protein n=1 Tax=Golovinomyces cichoracearum TaxID=62708 RepID=A0A420I0X7_9PEZI|nr:hypothetical protein GcC1_139023 [Golovinomyces cichoracearum]
MHENQGILNKLLSLADDEGYINFPNQVEKYEDFSGHNNDLNSLPSPSPTTPPEITSTDYLTNNELAIVPKDSKRALRAKAISSTCLDTANIIEGKRNRKIKLLQFLASQNPYKSYHVAFAASKGMVEPIGLHSSKLPKPPVQASWLHS